MNMSIWDNSDRRQEDDGTWTVYLSPWSDKPITGLKDKATAEHILDVAHEAMRSYADNAMTE